MKVATLILVHRYPGQAIRLVQALLSDPDFGIFIHVDAKAPEVYQRLKAAFADQARVVFTPRRFKVYWGSYNQIRATLELMRCAAGKKFDYYSLISGQDVPVKPLSVIKGYLQKKSGTEFLAHNALPDHHNWGEKGGMDRLEQFWVDVKIQRYSYSFNKLNDLIHKYQKRFHHRRKLAFTPYGGANWFDLSHAAVSYVLDFVKNNPSFVRRFRLTRCADEIFMQSILCNSPFKNKLVNNCQRYIDWNSGPEHPRILRMDDLDKMLASENTFYGRKFDETVDKDIIATLYDRIHE